MYRPQTAVRTHLLRARLGADFVEAVVISATYTYLCLLAAADDDSQPCYRPARGRGARSSTARL